MSDSTLTAPRSLGILRLIAVFKFIKASLVIVTGFGLLSFFHPAFAARLYRMVGALPYAFEQQLLRRAIGELSGLSPSRIQIIAAVTLLYAVLFIVEGVGLWRGRHWAEWLTVIATCSLVPVELYELARHPSANKALVVLANLAIVAYLVWRLRREAAARRALTVASD